MRVLVASGSGLSADSGLPTFRGAGGVYDGMPAEAFLSAATYARDPEAVEAWLDSLRAAADAAEPNPAHVGLAAYQARYPDTRLFTQDVDTLLERAGAADVVHLHGRLDQLRCLGHAHVLPLGVGGRAGAPSRWLNNLHDSPWLPPERFTAVMCGRAGEVIEELVATLDRWRTETPGAVTPAS